MGETAWPWHGVLGEPGAWCPDRVILLYLLSSWLDKYEVIWQSLVLMKDECVDLLSKVLREAACCQKGKNPNQYTQYKSNVWPKWSCESDPANEKKLFAWSYRWVNDQSGENIIFLGKLNIWIRKKDCCLSVVDYCALLKTLPWIFLSLFLKLFFFRSGKRETNV